MLLQHPFRDAGKIVLNDLSFGDLFEKVDAGAVTFARTRAAEMIGKKWVDGQLLDNPDARWVITDATREMVHDTIVDGLENGLSSGQIAQNIADSDAFSSDRADAIARTEVAHAASQGQLETYKVVRGQGVDIQKEWRADADPCEDCQENEDAGPISLDDVFPSGEDAPPAHPNCECVLLSVVHET